MRHRLNRCCCGRIEGCDDDILPVLINDTLHERLGPYGAFCGPHKDHQLRDARAEIALLKLALQLEKEQRAFIQSHYDKLNERQTRQATECATAKE